MGEEQTGIDDPEAFQWAHGGIPRLALSYGWAQRGHPDPQCWQLAAVGHLLGMLLRSSETYKDIAVFWDYFSIDQIYAADGSIVGRTPHEERCFKAALKFMQVVYGHNKHMVWRLNNLPPNVAPLVCDRGWPFFEEGVFAASSKVKYVWENECGNVRAVLVFDDRDQILATSTWGEVIALGSAIRIPIVLTPEDFRIELAAKIFTGKGDKDVVAQLYDETFQECLCKGDAFPGLAGGHIQSALDIQRVCRSLQRFQQVYELNIRAELSHWRLFFDGLASESIRILRINEFGGRPLDVESARAMFRAIAAATQVERVTCRALPPDCCSTRGGRRWRRCPVQFEVLVPLQERARRRGLAVAPSAPAEVASARTARCQ